MRIRVDSDGVKCAKSVLAFLQVSSTELTQQASWAEARPTGGGSDRVVQASVDLYAAMQTLFLSNSKYSSDASHQLLVHTETPGDIGNPSDGTLTDDDAEFYMR